MTFENFSRLVADISHVPAERVKENSSFREDLGIDSLQMVNLFTRLSMEFNAGIEVIESPHDMVSVGNLYRAFCRGGNK
jgi:acyl carrier protein